MEAKSLSLYPNPARHGFYVEGVQGEQLLRVFNLAGVEVLQQRITGNTMVYISNLPTGSYVVRIGNRVANLVKL